MLRQVHPISLRATQHAHAESLRERCLEFSEDWNTLKWEFSPNFSSAYIKSFNKITGKEDLNLVLLREKVCFLVHTTRDTMEARSNSTHTDAIRDFTSQLEWMIRKTIQLKVNLEGDGHTYRDGKPSYKVIVPRKAKPIHTPPYYPQYSPTPLPPRSPIQHATTSYEFFNGPSNTAPTAQPFSSAPVPNNNPMNPNFMSLLNTYSPSQVIDKRIQDLESQIDYLEQELGSQRYDNVELREDMDNLQAEYAKLNNGKRYRKSRPDYYEAAIEASIDKVNPWVRNSRPGDVFSGAEEMEDEEMGGTSHQPMHSIDQTFHDLQECEQDVSKW